MTKTTTVQQADRAVIVTDTAVDEEDDCSEECCPICYESYTPVWRLPPPLPSSSSSDAVALAIDYGRPSSTRYVDDGNDTSTALDDNNDDDDDDVNTNRNNSTTTSRTVSPSSSSSSFDENCIMVAMESDQQRTIDLDDDLDLEIGAPPSRRRPHPNEKVRIPGCQHTFCRDCLQNHCVYTIGLHKVPIRCPALGCSSLLPVGLIRDSIGVLDKNEHDRDIDDDDNDDNEKQEQEQNQAEGSNGSSSNDSNYWIQFQRLHQMYLDNNNNLLQHHQQQQQHDDDTTTHTGGHRDSESDRDPNVKPCSHCLVPIYKEAGCDHIVCPRCDQDMCFKCGTHMYLTGRLGNDNASMIRECLKCQQSFVDHRHRRAYRCLLILLLPVCLPICIIYASMAALLAVGTGGCCCCLGCGIRIQPRQPRPRSTMVPKKKKKKKRSNTVSANNNNHNTNDEQNSNNSNSNTINCGYVRKGTAAGTLSSSSSSSVTRNNDTNNNSIHSTTGTTTTTRTTRKKRNTRSVRWMPVVAIQRVLGFIFLPFLDLFFQLGITDKCCPGSNCGEFTKHVSLKYLFCFWKDEDENEDEFECECDDEDCDYEYEYTGDDEYGCTDDDEETN